MTAIREVPDERLGLLAAIAEVSVADILANNKGVNFSQSVHHLHKFYCKDNNLKLNKMIRCPFFSRGAAKNSLPTSLPEGLPPARRGWGWYDRSQDDQGGHTPQSLRWQLPS